MNFKEFKDQAKPVLNNQNIDQVERFLNQLELRLSEHSNNTLNSSVGQLQDLVPLTPAENRLYEKAYYYLKAIYDLSFDGKIIHVNREDILADMERIVTMLCHEFVLSTSGKRSQLTLFDLRVLHILKLEFQDHFPKCSHIYRRNNLLWELGVQLLGKPIPSSVNKLIVKLIIVTNKVHTLIET